MFKSCFLPFGRNNPNPFLPINFTPLSATRFPGSRGYLDGRYRSYMRLNSGALNLISYLLQRFLQLLYTPITLRQFLPKHSTLHGMRSAFRDWAGEETAFEKELCEFAIAHVESKTEQAYRHAKAVERRRPLMQTWSDYLSGIPNDNILVFRKLT